MDIPPRILLTAPTDRSGSISLRSRNNSNVSNISSSFSNNSSNDALNINNSISTNLNSTDDDNDDNDDLSLWMPTNDDNHSSNAASISNNSSAEFSNTSLSNPDAVSLLLRPNDSNNTSNNTTYNNNNFNKKNLPSSSLNTDSPYTSPSSNQPQFDKNKLLLGKTLKFFSPKSKLRLFCHKVLSLKYTHLFLTILLLIQIGLLSYQHWKFENGYVFAKGYNWVDWILVVFYIIYTVEMFMKIVAYGLFQFPNDIPDDLLDELSDKSSNIDPNIDIIDDYFSDSSDSIDVTSVIIPDIPFINSNNDTISEPNTLKNSILKMIPKKRKHEIYHYLTPPYFRTDWNRLDFVSIISFWISFFIAFKFADSTKAQIFRSLMCLRIVHILSMSSFSRKILASLKNAAYQSKDIWIFLICFWILLSIIGVESFKSSFRRQCVWENPNNSTDTFLNEFQFCGSWLDENKNPMPYILPNGESSLITKGYTCPVNSKCISGENPYNGKVSFDNIVQSMQSVFVIISANTFTDLMYYTMDSDSMAAALFFIISIFILVVWLLNLFIAVIIHSYKENHQPKQKSLLNKYKTKYEDFVNNSKYLKHLVKFEIIPVTLIIVWFCYSCTKTRQNGVFKSSYYTADLIVSSLLLLEIVFRFTFFIIEKNPQVFFYSIFNSTDLFIAIFSFVLSLPPVYKSLSSINNGWLSIFGILRFYRVIHFIKPLRNAWMLALKKFKPFMQLVVFGMVLLYLVSIILARLVEGVVPVDEMSDNPWIMYNLPNTIVSLFIITTTENWSDILYTVESYSTSTFNTVCVATALIFWFILSNTVLMGIFIAIITGSLELPETEKKINQIKQFVRSCIDKIQNNNNTDGLFDLMKNNFDRNVESQQAMFFLNKLNENLVMNGYDKININDYINERNSDRKFSKKLKLFRYRVREALYINDLVTFLKSTKNEFKLLYLKLLGRPIPKELIDNTHLVELIPLHPFDNINEVLDEDRQDDIDRELQNLNSRKPVLRKFKEWIKSDQNVDRSLFIFTNNNSIRKFCQLLTTPVKPRIEGKQPSPKLLYFFNVFMFLASVVVVVLACYETPLYRKVNSFDDLQNNWMIVPDIFFMVIFTIEFVIKIIADGWVFGERSYFKSVWNSLDFIVLTSFWITVSSTINNNYSSVITFGALKALRAFRLLTITNESQMVFHFAVVSAFFKIFSAAFVSLSLLVPFALWGLNIFSHELSHCVDGESTLGDCVLEFENEVFNWNILSPNYIKTPYLYFDNFGNSAQTLFEILSLEGWVDLLSDVMNIRAYGEQPHTFRSPGNGLFVIIFIFCATIFIINLFIAIIINNYALETGTAFLNNEQYGWYEIKKVLSKVRPSRRRDDGKMSSFQTKLSKIVTAKRGKWSKFMNFVLLCHFAVLLSECYPDSSHGLIIRNALYLMTSLTLLVHSSLVQYCLGFKVYYSNKFNVATAIILISSVIMSCISLKYTLQNIYYNIYKVFLVSVLILIIPQSDALNQLIKYGSASLFSLMTLLYTWLVLFLVFAIALNQLFGMTKLGPNTTGNLNARTVTKAMIMLFRNSFGEGWNYIARDFMIESPDCFAGGFGNSDCGNHSLAMFLFFVWNILSMYIFLNILISVVINNFSYVYHGSGPHKLITRDEIRKFKRAWNELDITGSGFIYENDLFKFLHSLDGVLSYHVYPSGLSLQKISNEVLFKFNDYNGYDFRIDLEKLNDILSLINFTEIRKRRRRYDKMIFELLQAATILKFGDAAPVRKIPFKDAILIIGYYSRFDDSTCLNLEDFLKHSTKIREINREIRKTKVLASIKTTFTRLRYKYFVEKCDIFNQIKNAPNAVEREKIKQKFRNSLKGADISMDKLLENFNNNNDEEGIMLDNNPFFNNNLYRVMSQSSRNPFSDVYETRKRNSLLNETEHRIVVEDDDDEDEDSDKEKKKGHQVKEAVYNYDNEEDGNDGDDDFIKRKHL